MDCPAKLDTVGFSSLTDRRTNGRPKDNVTQWIHCYSALYWPTYLDGINGSHFVACLAIRIHHLSFALPNCLFRQIRSISIQSRGCHKHQKEDNVVVVVDKLAEKQFLPELHRDGQENNIQAVIDLTGQNGTAGYRRQ